MNLNKIKKIIIPNFLFILCVIIIAIVSALIWPDTEDSPWYPNQYSTRSKALAVKYPNPDFNEPNLLNDSPSDDNNPSSKGLTPNNLIWWPLRIDK